MSVCCWLVWRPGGDSTTPCLGTPPLQGCATPAALNRGQISRLGSALEPRYRGVDLGYGWTDLYFIAEISAKIGASMHFEIAVVEQLAHNTRGKIRFIDQRLDLAAYG
jgi:hypothetical protein